MGHEGRREGKKYSVSFIFGFDGPSSLSVKIIVDGSPSQSGPGISATNSTELSAELESSGENSQSLKCIFEPPRETNSFYIIDYIAIYIVVRRKDKRRETRKRLCCTQPHI